MFKAQGKILKFDGYRRVLAPIGKQEDATLPALAEKQRLDRLGLTASQHFTQPPPRYNEASLIKALEKEGIGRPSTYASIIHKITSEERRYIEVQDRRFYATEIGKVVTDLLVEHFPRVMDLKFTSHMEEELDQIETRKTRVPPGADGVLGAVLGGAAGGRDEDAQHARPGNGRDVPASAASRWCATTARRRGATSSAAPAGRRAASTSSRSRARRRGRSRSRRNSSARRAASRC